MLTEEETHAAILAAKRLKYEAHKATIDAENRKRFKEAILKPWSPSEMYGYILDDRTGCIGFSRNNGEDGKKLFRVDEDCRDFVMAACYYFTNHPDFERLCTPDEQGGYTHHNWRLNKGFLVCGGVGVGKTTLMKLFSRNKRRCFDVLNCTDLSYQFAKKGEDAIEAFGKVHHYEPLDPNYFYQEQIGLCLDDMGTEEEKVNFGNKANVIAEIILRRYAAGLPYEYTHVTTNLTASALQSYYGPRVWSRITEMFNVIEIKGNDRRK